MKIWQYLGLEFQAPSNGGTCKCLILGKISVNIFYLSLTFWSLLAPWCHLVFVMVSRCLKQAHLYESEYMTSHEHQKSVVNSFLVCGIALHDIILSCLRMMPVWLLYISEGWSCGRWAAVPSAVINSVCVSLKLLFLIGRRWWLRNQQLHRPHKWCTSHHR
jgi:hypothetical protein